MLCNNDSWNFGYCIFWRQRSAFVCDRCVCSNTAELSGELGQFRIGVLTLRWNVGFIISVDNQVGEFRVDVTRMVLQEDHSWWKQNWWAGVLILIIVVGASVGIFRYCRLRRSAREQAGGAFDKNSTISHVEVVVDGDAADAHDAGHVVDRAPE